MQRQKRKRERERKKRRERATSCKDESLSACGKRNDRKSGSFESEFQLKKELVARG